MSQSKERGSFFEDAVNLPNMLTYIRILLIPAVLYFLTQSSRVSLFIALILYIGSTITDFLDGWLARKMGLESVLGKFLDPLADKLLVVSTLVFLIHLDVLNLFGTIAATVIIAREISITALRTVALSEGLTLAASRGGKDKTAVQMVALLFLIVRYPLDVDYVFFTGQVDSLFVGHFLLYLSAFLAITSGIEYFYLLYKAIDARGKS